MSARRGFETVPIEGNLLVIFGATGDLSRRKLFPALYRMLERREFGDRCMVLGVATRDLDDDGFRTMVLEALVAGGVSDPDARAWCWECLSYLPVTAGFDALSTRIEQLEEAHSLPGNRAFYLALPPQVFDDTVEGLGAAGLTESPGWTRVVVEKPFGDDLGSARHLNGVIHRWFREEQIFRIDHYLAKETVQNLLAFRFANPVFESVWNRDKVASVQITVAETLGIEGRASYFDGAGIIRDIVQNHAFQVLALTAMEPPVKLEADAIRDEKVKVLRSIYPLARDAVVRGRYERGRVVETDVPGYLSEPGVPPGSPTESFAAMRIDVDTWRWTGVPFYVRAGKRMAERLTQIAVRFREPPVCLFDVDGACRITPNVLYITLQPDEGFDLAFDVKQPGEGYDLRTIPLSFRYADLFGDIPGAYETVLADLLAGDQTLFVRSDEVEEAWRILDPVLDIPDAPDPYPAGSWGPATADRLAAESGDHWLHRPAQGARTSAG